MSLTPVPLSSLSEDFGRIEYELQLQLNAPKLAVSECFDLSSPHSAAQFMSFCSSMTPQNVVNVFIPTSELHQSISDIAVKGLKVDVTAGLKFMVGRLPVDRAQDSIEVVRVAIALGSCLNYESSPGTGDVFAADSPSRRFLKPGYHSLCVSADSEYIVFDNAQVKACHLVRFAGGENLAESSDMDDICDLCQTNQATIWCINDSAKLCPDCDETSHSGNRILQNHKRLKLAESRALMEVCPLHRDVRVEYYCPQCLVPVCLTCKMTGSHSVGDAASHPLVPIGKAYADAIEASAKEDPILVRRKAAISEKLAEAESKLQAIADNATEVEAEIRRIAEVAINRLKEESGERALIARSAKTELLRKDAELTAFSSIISHQKRGSGPLAFLRAFDRQNLIVGSMQGVSDLPGVIDAGSDLRVDGSLEVVAGDVAPKQQAVRAQGAAHLPAQLQQQQPVQPHSQYQAYQPQQQSQSSAKSSVPSPPAVPPPQAKSPPGSPPNRGQQGSPSASPPRKRTSLKRKSEAGPDYTSLVALAQRREQKNRARGVELTFRPFQGSSILETEAQSAALYLCFPFKAQPQTHLLFSTERDTRSISKMHKMIDGIGITAVLIKKDDFVFGGFAAAKWRNDGESFGEGSSSFLFSVSQDAFIPYRPTVKDACHLYATEDSLTFGKYDLILADNFDGCSCMLECSYGIGFQPGSTEAQTFLAGESSFRADIVEVWGFFTIEQQ